MLYGRESILPDEVTQTTYVGDQDFERAVEDHIEQMCEINRKALDENRHYQSIMKSNFDRRFIKSRDPHQFKVGDKVLFNVKRKIGFVEEVSNAMDRAMYTITKVSEGQLFDLEYLVGVEQQRFICVHPEFLKPFRGQVS